MKNSALSAVLLLSLALGACTSTEATLDPAAIAPADTASTPSALPPVQGSAATGDVTPGTASPSATSNQPRTAAIASATRVQLAPIVGSTVESVTPLTRRISARARERGVRFTASTETGATHVMKGYFSVLSEGSRTTVIYVWDVVDPSGARLHRIQGQEVATGSEGEGWAAVPDATMEKIADRTIDELVAWLSGQSG